MSEALVTARMDTSKLEAVIPELVSFGRRTVKEQCVTSMGMILQDGQNWTPFVGIGRMDAELDAPAENERLAKLGFTEGDAIVMARSNPDSNFNKITGSRWALTLPKTASIAGFGRAYGKENAASMFLAAVIQPIMERMRSARHSSGHFLQAGFKAALQICVTSPFYKNRYRKREAFAPANPLNELDISGMGTTLISDGGDSVVVTGQNNVGDRMGTGNATLDSKHRQALIDYASGPLQEAVDKESDACVAELDRRLNDPDGFPRFNAMLS